MALILDTGPLVAALDRSDADHAACRRLLESAAEPLVIPSPVLVEVEYWTHRRLGTGAWLALLDDIDAGAFVVDDLTAVEEGTARATGLQRGQVGSLLATLAPVVMGALGKVKHDRHLDEDGVVQLVEAERRDLETAVPEARDGDLRRMLDEASGGDDVAPWADRFGAALGGSLTARKEPPN